MTKSCDRAPGEVWYNGDCPVCRTAMSRYADICAGNSIDLRFIDAIREQEPLAGCGLRREHLERRVYLRDASGRLLSGMPALLELWSRLPGYRWRSAVFGAPLLRQMSALAYDVAIAPGLAFLARRRPARPHRESPVSR